MAGLKVFDTNAMVALAHGQIESDAEFPVVISIITRIELLAWPNLGEEFRNTVRRLIADVEAIQIEAKIEEIAVLLRTAKVLKLPDAIIAATAISLDAVLVTNDKGFSKVDNLRVEGY